MHVLIGCQDVRLLREEVVEEVGHDQGRFFVAVGLVTIAFMKFFDLLLQVKILLLCFCQL